MENKTKKITLIIISIALLLVLSVGGFFLWKKLSSNKQQDVTVTEVTPIEDSNELVNEEREKNTYSEEIQTESENVEDVLNKGYLHPTSFLGTEEEKFLSSLKELGFTNVKKIGTINSNFSEGTISYYSPDGDLKLDTLIEYRVSLGPKVLEKINTDNTKDKTSNPSVNNSSDNNSQVNKPNSDNNNSSNNDGQEDKPTPHVHTYTSTVIQSTCKIEGYTEHKCSCGDSYKDNYTEKLSHTYVDTIVAPTCEHKGYTEHKCSVCGYTYEDNYIDAIGHDFSDNSETCKNECGAENPEYIDQNKPANTEDFIYNDNVYKDNEMVVSDTVTTNIKNLKPGDIILKMEEGVYTEAVKLVKYNNGTWTYVYPTINEIFEDYQINVSPTIDYSKAIVYEQEITEAIANEMAKTLSSNILFDVVSAEEITNFLSVERENVKSGIKVVITFDIIKFINSKNLEIPKGLDTNGKIIFDAQCDLDGTKYLKTPGSPDHKISVQLNTIFNLNIELSASKGEIEGIEDVENAFKKAMITLFNGEEYKIATIPIYEGGILHTDADVFLFLDMDMNVDLTSKYHEQNTKTFWVIYNEKTRKVTTGLDDKGPTWSYELDVYGKLEIWTGLDLRMNVELINEHLLAASLDIKVGPYLDMYGKFNFTVSNTEPPSIIKTLYAEIGLRLASHFKVYRECLGIGCEGKEIFFENDVFDSGKMKITSFGEKEVEISYNSSTRKVSFYDVSTNKVSDREVDDKEFCLRKNDNYDKTKSETWEEYEYTWNSSTNKCSDENDTEESEEEKEPSEKIDISNINTDYLKGDFSTIGNLVNINNTQYRVLSINGTQVKVMSMENLETTHYNNPSETISFENYEVQKYEDSIIDRTMMLYYEHLPFAIQNAIVEQNISQSIYQEERRSWDYEKAPNEWIYYNFVHDPAEIKEHLLVKKANIEIGKRKVFVPDVDDVIAYIGDYMTGEDVNEMFFNVREPIQSGVWLRSASASSSENVYTISAWYGCLQDNWRFNGYENRPTFVIDLALYKETTGEKKINLVKQNLNAKQDNTLLDKTFNSQVELKSLHIDATSYMTSDESKIFDCTPEIEIFIDNIKIDSLEFVKGKRLTRDYVFKEDTYATNLKIVSKAVNSEFYDRDQRLRVSDHSYIVYKEEK